MEHPKSKRLLHHLPVHVPEFLTSPQSKVAKEGGSVKLEFSVIWTKNDKTETIWEKDCKVLSSKTCPRINTLEHGEVRCLEICDVKLSDAGVYQISVINSNGRTQRSIRLDVIGRTKQHDKLKPLFCSSSSEIVGSVVEGGQRRRGNPSTRRIPKELISMNNRVVKNSSPPPTVLQHLSNFTCTEGEKIELVTKIKGAEEVVWVKNDQLIENSPYFKYVHDQSQELYKLVIQDTFTQDSGLYICEAYNQFGGIITFATITVTDTSIEKSGAAKYEKSVTRPKRLIMDKVNRSTRQKEESSRIEQNSSLSKPEPEVSDSSEYIPLIPTLVNGNIKCDASSEVCEVSHDVHIEKIENSNTNGRISPLQHLNLSSKVSQNMRNLNKKSDLIETKTMTENLESLSSKSNNESTFVTNVSEDTVTGIIDKTEETILLEETKVYDIPTTVQFDERAEKHNFQNDDPRHDSGIIAGIDVCEIEKTIEEEHFSEIDLSPLCQPSTSLVLSLREDSMGKTPSVMGPTYLIAMKDELVFIRIKYSGVPQAKVQWTKSGKVCKDIVENSELSSVRIEKVSYDDSGRYVARISNDHGTILHYCFLAVEGPPEPPSTPPTTVYNDSTSSISISWSGSPYDGGSIITGYIVQINIDEKEWSDLSVVNWLTYSFTTPTLGASYQFRVHCKNMYGVGPPSEVSSPISIPTSSEMLPDDGQHNLECIDVQIRRGSLQNFYIKGEELGKGRFGVVFSAKHKENGIEYAGKIVRCIKAADKVKVRQEVEIMNILRHQKLLQIMDAMENDKEICIITEKINGGELFERVVADDFTLTEFDCVGFMRQICDGVRFMHLKNVIHLDLKPENILCLTRSTYNIKIIDFGLSQKYDNSVPLRVLFGTPEFIAPEIINYEPISPASDLWALGVITYVLLSGLSPFMGESDSETFSNITQGIFDFDDESFDHISDDAKDFISKLLIRRQEKRLTATECLAHKWLAYPEPTKNIVIPTDKLKRFIIRRKWQKTGNAIRALGRMANLYSSRKSGSTESATAGSRKSEDSGTEITKTRESSSVEEELEDETQIERKRQFLQRQQRVDSSNI